MASKCCVLLGVLWPLLPAAAQSPARSSLPGAVSPGALQPGKYAFLLQGVVTSPGAQVPAGIATIGSLTLDASGRIFGEEDVNSGAGVDVNAGNGANGGIPVSGTCAFNQDGTGMMTLVSGIRHETRQFAIFLPATLTPTLPTYATMVETDGSATGIGFLQPQPLGSAPSLNGPYAFDLRGETACGDCSGYEHDHGLVLASGQVTFGQPAGGQTPPVLGAVSETVGTTVVPNGTMSGGYLTPDAEGRFLFMATEREGYPDEPQLFVGYVIDRNNLFLMSLDSHATAILVSGTARGPD